LSRRSLKGLKKLGSPAKEEVLDALERIIKDPHRFKPLKYELKGYYRARVGTLRIVYRIDENEGAVFIAAIDHRKKVYSGID